MISSDPGPGKSSREEPLTRWIKLDFCTRGNDGKRYEQAYPSRTQILSRLCECLYSPPLLLFLPASERVSQMSCCEPDSECQAAGRFCPHIREACNIPRPFALAAREARFQKQWQSVSLLTEINAASPIHGKQEVRNKYFRYQQHASPNTIPSQSFQRELDPKLRQSMPRTAKIADDSASRKRVSRAGRLRLLSPDWSPEYI